MKGTYYKFEYLKKLIFQKNILALYCGINKTLHNSKRKTLIKTSKIRVKMSNRD